MAACMLSVRRQGGRLCQLLRGRSSKNRRAAGLVAVRDTQSGTGWFHLKPVGRTPAGCSQRRVDRAGAAVPRSPGPHDGRYAL